MARPRKQGMDYFPHDTDASNDEKIEALRALYGNDGYAFYFILLERIYRTAETELDISKPAVRAGLVSRIGVTPERFDAMLQTAFEVGCLDEADYVGRGVLTSQGAKKRAAEVRKMRERWRERRDISVDNGGDNPVDNPQDNAEETPESKSKHKVQGTRTVRVPTSPKTVPTKESVHVRGGTRKGAATNPDVKTFIDYYHDRFVERFGEKPVIDGGKDGAQVKKLLAAYGLDRLRRLLDDFFASADPFVRNSGYTLGAFKSQVNKLITRPPVVPPGHAPPEVVAYLERAVPDSLKHPEGGRP